MIPLAVTASVASITEPIDFLFCFVSPLLWVAHAFITGGFMVLLHVLHVRAFTSNLLANDTALKYLKISYTSAAKDAEELDTCLLYTS